jgi:hypothetical protein
MPDPSPHPHVITLGIDRPADLLIVARCLDLQIRRPAWDTDRLRARLLFLLTWAESQPATGLPDAGGTDIDGDRWVHRFPTIPCNHPLHGHIEALGHKIQRALTLLDQGALKDATQAYDEIATLIEQLSARLAEPDAMCGAKIIQGVSQGGQQRSALYAPFREQARAEACRIWQEEPNLLPYPVAKKVHPKIKPARLKPTDKENYRPSIDRIRKWIVHLKPPDASAT